MKIDKRVEIFLIATFLSLIALIFSLLGLIAWLCYMIVYYWWTYIGIKTVCCLTTSIIILYLIVRFCKRLERNHRAERLRRIRIWRTFYKELRNEAYLRGAWRRREQAKKALEIRQQNDKELKQRMKRLVEGGKALDEKREQCVKEHKQSLKTRELDVRKKLKEEDKNTKSSESEAPKHLLSLLKERKENMEKIIQRRNDERNTNSQEKKDNNSSINDKEQAPNMASIRAACTCFIEGVKRIDQACKSYKMPKMYYKLYNIDYAMANVLFSMKELLNFSGSGIPLTQRSKHETLGWCKSVTNFDKESQTQQHANKSSSATDIHCVEEEIDQLLSTAHSKILLVRDRVLQSVNHLDKEQSSTIGTPGMVGTTKNIEQLDIQQIQSCFRQDDIIEVFKELRDVILPKFRKCITKKMETNKINTTNMDHWERKFNENLTKVHNRQSLTHLEVGNGYVGKIFVEKPLKKEKGSLERTQSLWCYVPSDQPKKRKRKTRWLESFRRSNKDNGVTYLAVGSAAVVITAAYAVYRSRVRNVGC